MRYFLFLMILFTGCAKEHGHPEIAIYELSSFRVQLNRDTDPHTVFITDARLAGAPLVSDKDIRWYDRGSHTFRITNDLKTVIGAYGSNKAFAVTIDKEPVYYGLFHPAYLSSLVFGLATIDPIVFDNKELPIQYVYLQGNASLQALDKRNDARILNSLKASGRLR